MTTQQAAFTTTNDGTQIRYRTTGRDRASTRLVLIHSLALDSSIWAAVTEGLAHTLDAAILMLDCRGHGASSAPRGPYTLELVARDVVEVMNALDWPKAIVAGASMGGSVAQALTIGHPARVSALGLIDTTAWYGPGSRDRWAERATQARLHGLSSLVDFQLERWFSEDFRGARPDVLTQVSRVFLANDVEAYAATCEMLGSFDLRAQLSQIAVPTAIVVGEDDYATPVAMSEQLADGIHGATIEVLPRARHLTPIERPEDIARTLSTLASRAFDA